MAIVQEEIKIKKTKLVKTYSDQNVLIKQVETGALYGEAIDVIPCPYTYEETDEPITVGDSENNEDMRAYAEAGMILLGKE